MATYDDLLRRVADLEAFAATVRASPWAGHLGLEVQPGTSGATKGGTPCAGSTGPVTPKPASDTEGSAAGGETSPRVAPEPSAASGGLVWKCKTCGNVEPVETEGYDVGDNEPCVHCDGGVAVVLASAASGGRCAECGYACAVDERGVVVCIMCLREQVEDLQRSRPLGCYDCGRRYEKGPDLVVSDEDWAKIAPHDGQGVLCPNCMHDRFVALGVPDGSVSAEFKSGPFACHGTGSATSAAGRGRCAECGGARTVPVARFNQTGWESLNARTPCPACHGTGAANAGPSAPGVQITGRTLAELRQAAESLAMRKCSKCGGQGWIRGTSYHLQCKACHGTGAAAEPKCEVCRDKPEYEMCPACGAAAEATGQTEKCITCAGTGASKGGHMRCPDCRGSGRKSDAEAADEEPCPVCGAWHESNVPLSRTSPLCIEELRRDLARAEEALAEAHRFEEQEQSEHDAMRAVFRAALGPDEARDISDADVVQYIVNQRDAARAELTRYSQAYSECHESGVVLTAAVGEWRGRAEKAEAKLAATEERVKVLELSKSALNETIDQVHAECAELRKACAEKDARIGSVTAELGIARSEHAYRFQQERIAELEQRADAAEARVRELEAKCPICSGYGYVSAPWPAVTTTCRECGGCGHATPGAKCSGEKLVEAYAEMNRHRERADAAESALERARGLANGWLGTEHVHRHWQTALRAAGRELLAAIEGKS